ncbi:hypothetical protein ARMSODRAFT_967022 [Armillaria solidipes]|uniref:Uncharacterized protein n=1 Tax=Armillaria solidipes TaxID=1076256 RepID=A0A2H3AK44_9AGAR|nr:hypothetical protein ARMSODRAFT_967022 [Armillaria solidipes]
MNRVVIVAYLFYHKHLEWVPVCSLPDDTGKVAPVSGVRTLINPLTWEEPVDAVNVSCAKDQYQLCALMGIP